MLQERLEQTWALVRRSLSRPERLPILALVLQTLRGVVSNLACGLAFGACAYRLGRGVSLLEQWLGWTLNVVEGLEPKPRDPM